MKIDKTCPKCGHDDSHMQYYAEGDTIKGKDVKTCIKFVKNIKDIGMESFARGTVEQACVMVHCRTCQYAWAELPADDICECTNAFGMSLEDIERCKKELQESIHPFMKDNQGNFPYWLMSDYNPDWYNRKSMFDGWER